MNMRFVGVIIAIGRTFVRFEKGGKLPNGMAVQREKKKKWMGPATNINVKRKKMGNIHRDKRRRKALCWLNSYDKASTWVENQIPSANLASLLDQHGGLVKIPNFLPLDVAETAFDVLKSIPERAWLPTTAERRLSQNNITHRFSSTKSAPNLDPLLRCFTLLMPDELHTFSAARYAQAGEKE
jgi:hypothetical protein